jgi:hypothetical protein
MEHYLYMTAFPEALVASMLPPEDFCKYLAVGTEKRAHEHAILFQISSDLKSDYFKLSDIPRKCVPHADGSPKNSLYISIYRVMEHIPLEAFQSLFLVTRDGVVLRLDPAEYSDQGKEEDIHLYEELCPVTPTIVSKLGPRAFSQFITDRTRAMWLPKVAFGDLHLGDLGGEDIPTSSLPYKDIEHIRNCIVELRNSPDKETKTVNRTHSHLFLYRTIRSGFFLGEGDRVIWYPFPSMAELKDKYYSWWRSASLGL